MASSEGPYVKLTEDQIALQNITPGELNQPIDIEKLSGRTCEQCGQALPASYSPPADEDWATGIFGCLDDPNSCMTGLFCPCLLFGRNVAAMNDDLSPERACVCHAAFIEGGIAFAALTAAFNGVIDPDTVCLITEGLLFAWWVCAIYTGMGRQLFQRKYHLKDAPCDPCMVHCCLHWCAICQEHREMKHHLSQEFGTDPTIVDPPQLQEMNASGHDKPSSPSARKEAKEEGHSGNNLQLHTGN